MTSHDEMLLADRNAEIVKLRAAIAKHHDQKADDRCWLDDAELYAAAGLPQHDDSVGSPSAMLANCERFITMRCSGGGPWVSYLELEKRVAKLQAFKNWMHAYLDAKGVPHHPPGIHGAEGCRIGDRMDWVFVRLEKT